MGNTPIGNALRRGKLRSVVMAFDAVIIGLGYVGLPLALAASQDGLKVAGVDVNPSVTEALNKGVSHVDDLSNADIAGMVDRGFRATTDESILGQAETIVICVPTPLADGGRPELGAVEHAVNAIARNLQPGTLVILESTTYPGTTDEVVRPILEETGLVAGKDFYLVFSPERIDPGNPTYGMRNTPKVVGGYTPECGARGAAFYSQFVDEVVQTKGTREAETAKLLENTYRHINIALVNEMSRFCHDLEIDLWDVINAAKTKPFGFQAFYPGPGVGGHCIPIDPNYLSYNVRARLGYPFRFVELAQEINATAPHYVVRRAQDVLNDQGKPLNGSTVLLLGVTYKANIADQRESPAVPVAKHLFDHGADVIFHDPKVSEWHLGTGTKERVDDLDRALKSADLTILLQQHAEYDIDYIARTAQFLFDTKGVAPEYPSVERL